MHVLWPRAEINKSPTATASSQSKCWLLIINQPPKKMDPRFANSVLRREIDRERERDEQWERERERDEQWKRERERETVREAVASDDTITSGLIKAMEIFYWGGFFSPVNVIFLSPGPLITTFFYKYMWRWIPPQKKEEALCDREWAFFSLSPSSSSSVFSQLKGPSPLSQIGHVASWAGCEDWWGVGVWGGGVSDGLLQGPWLLILS